MGKKRPFGPGPRVKRVHLTLLDEPKEEATPLNSSEASDCQLLATKDVCLHLHIRRAIKSTSINIKHRLP
jgi:hypothetical protein